MHFADFLKIFISIFAITNPFGNMAIFIGLTADKPATEQKKVALNTAMEMVVDGLRSSLPGLAH